MPTVGISHQMITLQSADEAESFAGYLNEHGIFAVAEHSEVRAAASDNAADQLIRTLTVTFPFFWDNSDSGLFGLPMFIKET